MRAQKIVSFPLGILLLLIVAFVLWKLITLDFLVFGIPEREGITDTHPTTFKITGRSNRVFQADIPLNYIQYRKYAEMFGDNYPVRFGDNYLDRLNDT